MNTCKRITLFVLAVTAYVAVVFGLSAALGYSIVWVHRTGADAFTFVWCCTGLAALCALTLRLAFRAIDKAVT